MRHLTLFILITALGGGMLTSCKNSFHRRKFTTRASLVPSRAPQAEEVAVRDNQHETASILVSDAVVEEPVSEIEEYQKTEARTEPIHESTPLNTSSSVEVEDAPAPEPTVQDAPQTTEDTAESSSWENPYRSYGASSIEWGDILIGLVCILVLAWFFCYLLGV